jgi:hypothetical protein
VKRFKITVPDTEGREYVYCVTGNNEAHAACLVYSEHGQAHRSGLVPALLTPWFEAEEVGE